MSRRMAVTLSCGDNDALGPPISVLTHPGLTKTQVMPRGAKSIAALRITIFTAAPLAAGIKEPDIERINTLRHW
jgi:hypothetical protein